MKKYLSLLLSLAAAGCSYTIDPLKNYCAEPAVGKSIVTVASGPSPLPQVTGRAPVNRAVSFTHGTVRGSLFGAHYQVLACHGTVTRADGTQEQGVAVSRLKGGPVGWRDLWLDPASPDYFRVWMTDDQITAYHNRQISLKLSRTPAACKPYASDLLTGTHLTHMDEETLRRTLNSCLMIAGVRPQTPTGMDNATTDALPTLSVPYYLDPAIELSGPVYY